MTLNENCKVLIVGDEILSGKRKDGHLSKSIELLAHSSLVLSEARYLPDSPAVLVSTFKETFASKQCVFCFGGIGATPDDYTRAAVAEALGVPLHAHQDGVAILEVKFGKEAYPDRIKMVEFPEGSDLIPNPFNQIPGFSIHHHYFLPGFPQMAWPMMEWVLKTHYASSQNTRLEASVLAENALEGKLIPVMEAVVKEFPTLKLFSLPRYTESGGRELELGVRGEDRELIEKAISMIQQGLDGFGYAWKRQA
ncbi:MAG: molybdopterin-binding protein [Pseudomonadota bacterium]